MAKSFEMDIKVGLFVTIGTALIMLAIIALGAGSEFFTKLNKYTTHYPSVEGLLPGARVIVGGLNVGRVDAVDYDPSSKDIRVDFEIEEKYADLIRADSKVEIATQGVLGDKYIVVTHGDMSLPKIENGATIESSPPKDISDFLGKGDQLVVRLNSIATSLDVVLKTMIAQNRSEKMFDGMATASKNLAEASVKLNAELSDLQLKKTSQKLNSILEKVDNGTGTLGAFVNDPGLYDDMKSLMGGANRNKVIRNLVRQTVKKEAESGSKKQ